MVHVRAWVGAEKVEIHNSNDPNISMGAAYSCISMLTEDIPSLIKALQDAYNFVNPADVDYQVFSTK